MSVVLINNNASEYNKGETVWRNLNWKRAQKVKPKTK